MTQYRDKLEEKREKARLRRRKKRQAKSNASKIVVKPVGIESDNSGIS